MSDKKIVLFVFSKEFQNEVEMKMPVALQIDNIEVWNFVIKLYLKGYNGNIRRFVHFFCLKSV